MKAFLKDSTKAVTPALLSIDEFLAIAECPRQRDTDKNLQHGIRTGRFKSTDTNHLVVNVAEMPDNQLIMLDGHTRQLAWKTGVMEKPNTVIAIKHQVSSINEVKRLYYTFDNRQAAETGNDVVYGILRDCGIEFTSKPMKHGRFVSAMLAIRNSDNPEVTMETIQEYRDGLVFLDSLDPTAQRGFSAGLMAAIVVTYKKSPAKAQEFWTKYATTHGEYSAGKSDAVFALWTRISTRRASKQLGGGGNIRDTLEEALWAFHRYCKKEMFTMPAKFHKVSISKFSNLKL